MSVVNDDPSRHLVELIQTGINLEANTEQLFRLHYRGVVSFFLRRGLSSEEARDLAQDVFLRVFRGIGAFRGEAPFVTWLFEIAVHVFQNELRRRGAAKRKETDISIETGGPSDEGKAGNEGENREAVPFEPPPGSPQIMDDVLGRERAEALRRAIERLSEPMRTCIFLRYGHGLKYGEIATITGIPVETVKTYLLQAKERLQLELMDDLREDS